MTPDRPPRRKRASALRPPLRWTEFAHLRFTGRDPLKPRLDKERTAALIAELGVRGPRTHGVFERIEDVDFAALPDTFVLKPTELNGRRGVMLLSRRPQRRPLLDRLRDRLAGRPPPLPVYRDAMLGRELTVDAIRAEQGEWARLFAEKRHKPLRFIVEDLILAENPREKRPREYKVYAFAGEIGLIVQYDRRVEPPAAAFFDGDFRPIRDGDGKLTRGPKIQRGKPVTPKCAAEILEGAARISAALATPFVRVDFYAAREGAVLGELTVAAGGPYWGTMYRFSDAFDLEMGARWTAALARLGHPAPLYDERWSDERRRVSGLPVKLKAAGADRAPDEDAP